MACSGCLCRSKDQPKNIAFRKRSGWEVKAGYGVAMSLAILEAKRFFLLILEILVEWRIIRFSGGFRPVVFTLVDISVGFPCALAASYAIRKRQVEEPCCSRVKRMLTYLLPMVTTCAVLNMATLASIGFCVNVKLESVADLFNESMRLYVTSDSDKYAIDELQFQFQCCGHSSYADWFLFDWQKADYGPREDMAVQERISDEEYRPRGVPFSCCSLNTMSPCIHVQMTDADVETINNDGCSRPLSIALIKITIVSYVMTTTLAVIQVLLVFLMTKITRTSNLEEDQLHLSEDSYAAARRGSACVLLDAEISDYSAGEYSTENEWNSSQTSGELLRSPSKKSDSSHASSLCSRCGSQFVRASINFERKVFINNDKCKAARIKPSAHVEHRLPKRRLADKRVR